jgi:chromosome segregation ATPase
MATNVLQLIIQAVNKASKPINEVTRSTEELAKSQKQAKDRMMQLGKTALGVTATIAAFGFAAKKAFDLAKAGATITQTGQSFDFLIKKVGASEDLLQQLRTASRGTISDMDLMSSTATLLAGAQGELATELASSTPELLNIAKAASKLNPALGDTTFLYNSLATGVKRASPMILDNLGLTIRIGEANQSYADQLGKTVEQLTANEQKQALLNETLRAGRVLIDQAGGSAESAIDPFDKLGAEWENLTDRGNVLVHEVLTPMISKLADLIEMTNLELNAQDLLTQAFEQGLISADEYSALIFGYAETARDAEGNTRTLTQQLEILGAAWWSTGVATKDADAKFTGIHKSIVDVTGATTELVEAEQDLTQRQSDIAVALGESSVQIEQFKQMIKNTEDAINNLDDGQEDYQEQLDYLLSKLPGLQEGLEGAKAAFRDTGKAALVAATKVRPFTLSIMEAKFAVAQAEMGNDDYMGLLMGLKGEMTGTIDVLNFFTDAWEENKIAIEAAENATDDLSKSVSDNTIENERNKILQQSQAVAIGRTTQEIVDAKNEQERLNQAYRDQPTAENLAAADAQAVVVAQLEAAYAKLRGGLAQTATSYNQVASAAKAALEAQGAKIAAGHGVVDAGGNLRAAKIGAEWEMVHGEWRSGAAGRTQAEHAWDVIEDMKRRHSFDPNNPDPAALDFLYSSAGGGGTAFVDKLAVEAAMQAQKEGKDKTSLNAQHGANFFVPPGFNRDNFMLGVSSGEHVSVTPAHTARGGAGGGINIQNLTVSGVQTDSQLFEAVVRAARQRGRDFARVL